MKKNKLWALPVSEATLALNEKYTFFFSNHDHCLIISPEQPPHSMEANEKIIKLLSKAEWEWIYAVGQAIAAAALSSKLEKQAQEVAERFLAELERSKDGSAE